jgi:hypothetical protein
MTMANSIVVAIVGLAMILTSVKLWSSPSFHAGQWEDQAHRRFGPSTAARTKTAMRVC